MTGRSVRAAGWVLLGAAVAVGQPAKDDSRAATLTDATGKEQALTGVRFTGGVRRLGWLGGPKDAPAALELREPDSTTFQKGVTTLIPLGAVEAVRYDYAKVAVAVAVKGLPAPLAGSLQFKGINTCALDSAAGKFAGGGKDGFRSLVFAGAVPLPVRPAGAAWAVTVEQPKAMNPTHAVRNLKALYAAGAAEWLADDLPLRKGSPLKLDAAAFKKLELVAVDANTQTAAAELTPADGPQRLIAFPLTRERDGKTGLLLGLLGEVDAGWKLFPLHTVRTVSPAP
ncbi:hypothetical protein [Urbifossiella limnaea]|uniref:Uncharacterized protein n=1 Tax=Urbifossiella limnaea TaxID=2528023 RepID=A0A517XQ16_9BACT|nr:hypothetical protein [Urbifossiella limnaea]QDU19576.1 hypothetical protein ETAA1_15060 [Urbifossiella limnaea]